MIRPGRLFNFSAPRGSPFLSILEQFSRGGGGGGGGGGKKKKWGGGVVVGGAFIR